MSKRRLKRSICVALVVALVAACAAVTPIDPHRDAIREQVRVGDVVELTTAAGKELRFEVQAMDDAALSGEGERVQYAEIRQLGVVQPQDKGRGAIVVVVGLLVGLGLGWLIYEAVDAGTDAALGP